MPNLSVDLNQSAFLKLLLDSQNSTYLKQALNSMVKHYIYAGDTFIIQSVEFELNLTLYWKPKKATVTVDFAVNTTTQPTQAMGKGRQSRKQ